MEFDFYTVQFNCDGFGNDTVVDSIWRTEEEAGKRATEIEERNFSVRIVGGFFGEELDLVFN
jgi:hypothetical protein